MVVDGVRKVPITSKWRVFTLWLDPSAVLLPVAFSKASNVDASWHLLPRWMIGFHFIEILFDHNR